VRCRLLIVQRLSAVMLLIVLLAMVLPELYEVLDGAEKSCIS
jgi:hypothetical protein